MLPQHNDAKQLRQKSNTTYVNAYTVQALYLSTTELYLTSTKLYLLRKREKRKQISNKKYYFGQKWSYQNPFTKQTQWNIPQLSDGQWLLNRTFALQRQEFPGFKLLCSDPSSWQFMCISFSLVINGSVSN